jgi:serine/threonine-protein kinase
VRNERRIALKVLDRGITVARAVRRASLSHPNLVDIDSIEPLEDDCLGLSMELVNGLDVASLLAEAPFPIPHALGVVRQALEGLRVLHRAGIAHGDLKPENLMLTGIGIVAEDVAEIQEPVRVLDVGLAPRGEPLPYYSPEFVATGVASRGADLYAMGVILVEMLAGEPLSTNVRLRKDLPEELTFLLWKALQRDPRDRFRDAAEMIAATDNAARAFAR